MDWLVVLGNGPVVSAIHLLAVVFGYFHNAWAVFTVSTCWQFLAFDTQLIMGGKRYELNEEEEYIYGALNLYIDVVCIFMFILMLFDGDR